MASIPLILCGLYALFAFQEENPGAALRFSGPIIVRLEGSLHALRSGDLDGDGLLDLAVVNNGKARIELLLQRPRGREVPPPAGEKERNVPADDPLFEKRSILTERKVGGFLVADLDGDRRDDLAWYGEPKGLVIVFQGDKGSFEKRREVAIQDGSGSMHALAAGDLDLDGRTDLVLLGSKDVILIRQGPAGLSEPERHPAAVDDLDYVRLGDFDGDGRPDLLFAEKNDVFPLRVRFQRKDGGLGPEIAFRAPPIRSLRLLPNDPDRGFLHIPQASGTLRRVWIKREDQESGRLALGVPRLFPLGTKGGDKVAIGSADIDGDRRTDVVVADPQGARLLLFLQIEGGELAGPTAFPSYKDVAGVKLADFDGDGRPEVAVFSKEEKAAGLHAWDGKRLSFPRAIPVDGVPQAVEGADLDGDGAADLIVGIKDKKAARLSIRLGGKDAGARPPLSIELEPPSEIEGLRAVDFDRDGRADILVFVPFDPPRLFRGLPGLAFEEAPAGTLYRQASLQGLSDATTVLSDLDGDGKSELLFSKEGFARAAALNQEGAVTVIEQINGPAGAKIVAATTAELDGQEGPECVLLDAEAKALRVMARNPSGIFTEVRKVELGDADYKVLRALDLTGDGREDLLVAGPRRFALVPSGEGGLTLAEGHAYESPERDAHLTWLQVGDLGGPEGEEVVAVDAGNRAIEILKAASGRWKRLAGWKVFEAKTYERGGGGGGGQEPHDLLLADVTHDGRADIVLLVHDRIIVYPRE